MKEMDKKLRDIIEWAIHNGILAADNRVREKIVSESVEAIKKVLLEMKRKQEFPKEE